MFSLVITLSLPPSNQSTPLSLLVKTKGFIFFFLKKKTQKVFTYLIHFFHYHLPMLKKKICFSVCLNRKYLVFALWVFTFHFYFFFSHDFWLFPPMHYSCTVQGTHNHFIQEKKIKNGSHDTIRTFKNYFATVFLVFSKINCIQTDS